jgi:hypothetical protein
MNIRKYFLCKKYLNLFYDWIKEECKVNLVEKQSLVKKLVGDAGYGDMRVPHTELAGYGKIAAFEVNPIDAFPNRYEHIAHGIISSISQSKGVYKQRAIESFDPLFWLEFIIYFPKNILAYLGLSKNSMTAKLLNLIWWILGTVLTTMVLNAYSPELSNIIRKIFN